MPTNPALTLLETLFREMEQGFLLLSTQRRDEEGKPQQWVEADAVFGFDDTSWKQAVATRVAEIPKHHDIYFSVAPRANDGPQLRRAEHTAAITSLWADFDAETSSGGKSAETSWESLEEIHGFMWRNGIPEETAAVFSGNGWHLYWKLDEPLEWHTDGRAEQLLARWGAYLSERALRDDKHLDDVWDPSRVLRLPGTENWKSGHANPRTVTLEEIHPHREYGYTELDDLLPMFDADTDRLIRVQHGEGWENLKAQEVLDWLTEQSAETNSAEGQEKLDEALAAMRVAGEGGRHHSAYSVLAKLIQAWKDKGVDLNLVEAVEQLGQVFREVKPDAERNEWRNMVTHVTSRRASEEKLKANSVVDISGLRRATPEEEAASLSRPKAEAPGEWGEPRPLRERDERVETRTFPTDQLPDVMAEFVREVATDTQVADALPAIAALGTVSGATAGGFITRLNSAWEEGLALYVIGVADPSERKTATLKPFLASLYEAQGYIKGSTEQDRAEAEAKLEAAKAHLAVAKKSVGDDPDAYAHALSAVKYAEQIDARLTVPAFIHSDVTQEALATYMAEQNGVGLVISGEGGFVANLAGRYRNADSKIDLSMVNDGYSRAPIKHGRVTRGLVEVPIPHLVIINFIQPTIADQLARPEFMETGFLSRVLFVDPVSQVGDRDTRVARGIIRHTSARVAWQEMVTKLLARGWGLQEDPIILTLEPNAIRPLEDWWTYCEEQAGTGLKDPWWGKAHGQAVRVASVLQLAEDPEATQVTERNMHRAVRLMRYFAREYLSLRGTVVYGSAEAGTEARRVLTMVAQRQARGKLKPDSVITLRDIYRWTRLSAAEAENVVEHLCDQGWSQRVVTGRADSTGIIFHPSVADAFGTRDTSCDTLHNARDTCDTSRTDVRKKADSGSVTRVSQEETGNQGASVTSVTRVSQQVSQPETPASERGNREKEASVTGTPPSVSETDSEEGRKEGKTSDPPPATLVTLPEHSFDEGKSAPPSETTESEPGTEAANDSQVQPAQEEGSDTRVTETLKKELKAARTSALDEDDIKEDLKRWNPTKGDPTPTVPEYEEVEGDDDDDHGPEATQVATEDDKVEYVPDTEKVCPNCGGMKLRIGDQRRCVKCGEAS